MNTKQMNQLADDCVARISNPETRARLRARFAEWIEADARCNALTWKMTVTTCAVVVALALAARLSASL